MLGRFRDHTFAIGAAAEIALHHLRLAAGLFDRLGYVHRSGLGAVVVHRHFAAECAKGFCTGCTDTGGSTRYENNFAS